jgi:YD repeat-containing protein
LLLLCGLAGSGWQATAQQHPHIEKGFKPDQAYSVSDVDVVNLFNGNLNVRIPIGGTYSVGGALSYEFAIAYAGNNWDYEEDILPTVYAPPDEPERELLVRWAVPYRNLNAGMGWLFSLGRLIPPPTRTGASNWVYQAPDGSEHELLQKISYADDSYSMSGTYIRATVVRVGANIQGRKLEFADGTIKEFGLDGRLQTIRDRFDNVVTITSYGNAQDAQAAAVPAPGAACGSAYAAWKIADSHRTHYVYFLPSSTSYSPFIQERVCQASLAGFEGSHSKYLFTYTDRMISRQKVQSPVPVDPARRPSAAIAVPLLAKIELPYGSSYEMVYDAGTYKAPGGVAVGVRSDSATVPNELSDLASALNPGGFSGHLIALRIPTMGRYEWTYRRYTFPPGYGQVSDPIDPSEKLGPSSSAGVSTRKKFITAEADVWSYTSSFLTEGTGRSVAVTTVLAPDGSSTENYFSLYKSGGDRNFDYGAPYTQRPETDNPYRGMYISSRTTIPGVTTKRRSYVAYEWDLPSDEADPKDNNRRLKSRLTVFEDGKETSEIYSHFDGLGHYRTTTVEGFEPGDSGLGRVLHRVLYQNFNPTTPTNERRTFAATQDWLIGSYDASETRDLNPTTGATLSTSRREFCFDPLNGRLSRTRSLRGAAASTKDLLAIFKDADTTGAVGSIDGNISQEEYYGGDDTPLPVGFATCTGTLADPKFRLLHTYQSGSRASTQYDGWSSFKVLDLTIDASSGFPSSSRDVAGVGTALTYDLLGRLTSLAPAVAADRRATSRFLYTEATATAGPSVAATHACPSGSAAPCTETALPQARYYYDLFGRLVQQRTSMGSAAVSPWSASEMTYDAFGRRKTSSVAVGVPDGVLAAISPPGVTTWSYDILGRTKSIKQPDGSETTFGYVGVSAVTRTAKVATAGGAVDVTTKETFDAVGRLTAVSEDSTQSGIQTFYEYDEGDRLSKVIAGVSNDVPIQTRTFDYDGAGLLMTEDHPESEATTYEYDARGHVTKRVTDGSTLRFTYDRAERLQAVLHDPDGNGALPETTMKEFVFGTTGNARGRLLTAKRYNHHLDLGSTGIATVTETLAYNVIGRLASKTTAVTIPGTLRTFVDSYTYDDLGATTTVDYPACASCGLPDAAKKITNVYDHGFLKSVNGYASDIVYHANGMWAEIGRPKAGGVGSQTKDVQTLAATQMPRPESLAVTGHCVAFAITNPVPAKTVQQGADSDLSVTAPAGSSFQWYAGVTMVPNATGAELHVPVSQTTSFWVRIARAGCTVDSSESKVTVSACTGGATIAVPTDVNLGASAAASVQESGTYAWSIQNGTITSSANTQAITFKAACGGVVTLTVQFTAACGGGMVETSKNVPINVPVVTLTASPETLSQPGDSSTLTIGVNVAGSLIFSWADNVVSSLLTRVVTPATTRTYEIAQLNGCGRTPPWASVTVNVPLPPPPAPLTTTATTSSGNSIFVAWTVPGGATIDSYRIERCTTACTGAGNWTLVGTTSAMTFSNGSLPANAAYVYRVFSVTSGTSSTSASPADFASTWAFTDHPLSAESLQSVLHVTQLRTAINALRAAAGLSAYSYTDTMIAGLPVKAIYLTELQTAVNQARAVFGAAGVPFTAPAPAPLSLPLAAHVNELRGGVQ